uniref:hypothetical protein n=1 Tax=uncultured Draconibacterium sp. TaxID=1573823 RepID=UPI003217A02B
MNTNLISIVTRIALLVLLMHFVSCKAVKQNASTEPASYSTQPMIAFLSCTISYDSVGREYKMDLIDKIITEGRIKNTAANQKTYEQDDFKYCLLNKNKQVISFSYLQNPLEKTIEYVDENGLMGKKSIRLDSTSFSTRIQLSADTKYVCFEKDNERLLLVALNIE